MGNGVPIVIIVIGVLLVVIALLVWRRQKEVLEYINSLHTNKKEAFFAQWIVGLILALIGAFFMFDGDILGENTSGISTVIGIVGICLIATSNIHFLPLRRK
jgi:Na+/proline symporter